MAGQENQQYTVLYGRLSQEDERAGESNSIQHQRTLLEKYAKEKGFENTIFLADDGYSGTNFERPAWKKIVEMIEAGQVANLIVKDASRLGREYLQVGYYMETLFTHAFVIGLCYYLITRCSICTYMKKIGASELMPLFCELDEVTITLQHGLLHQKQTLASIATILLRKIKSKFKRESPDDSRALEILFLFITLSVVIFQSI